MQQLTKFVLLEGSQSEVSCGAGFSLRVLVAARTNPQRLKWLLKNTRSVIPRALLARGICVVLAFERKRILRFACLPCLPAGGRRRAQNDSHKAFSRGPEACVTCSFAAEVNLTVAEAVLRIAFSF
jgi:hypothetical protein